jgi:hypothetical protein
MFVKDYEWYFKHLVEHLDMQESDLVIVESVAGWCREHGIREKDDQKPVKLVSGNGAGRRMLIATMIPDKVIEERINAVRIRSQLKNLGSDWTEKLNSPTRKIVYLFLKEYASAMTELAYDDIAADEWIFEQMERIGVFQP